MRFIVTKELGKLARWLRIVGFDARYYTSDNLATLIIEVLREDRIIVTRRKQEIDALGKRTIVVQSNDIEEQLREVIKKLHLSIEEKKLFSRCTVCNTILTRVSKEEIKECVPAYVYATHDAFLQCALCQRVYWQGSHWGNVREVIAKIKAE